MADVDEMVFRSDGARVRTLYLRGCSVRIMPDSDTGDEVAAKLADIIASAEAVAIELAEAREALTAAMAEVGNMRRALDQLHHDVDGYETVFQHAEWIASGMPGDFNAWLDEQRREMDER